MFESAAVGCGTERDEAHRRAVVRVLPGAPQVDVGREDTGRHLLGQLLLRHLAAVVLLERDEQARLPRLAAREQALVLGRVELPVGLERRVAA